MRIDADGLIDSTIHHGADIMGFMQRPTDPCNKYRDKAMPEPAKEGNYLFYYKIRADVKTTKQLLNSIDKLRLEETKGNTETQVKKAMICGRDHIRYSTVVVFDGLSDVDITSFKAVLTPGQEDLIFCYCRHIFNGIDLLHGPVHSYQ